jgi:hypothetical protein
VLQSVVLEWLKKRMRQYRKAAQAYQIERREYEESMAALETILAARQAYVPLPLLSLSHQLAEPIGRPCVRC